MLARTHRQVSTLRRIAQALTYLRGEARAAALDEVAAAIGQAEQSVSVLSPGASAADPKARTRP